jgi:hypothetical protein
LLAGLINFYKKMKTIFFFLAGLFPLFVCSQANYYKGEWSRAGTSYNYSAFLKLTIRGNVAEGEIIWKLVSADSLNQESFKINQKKVSLSGIEEIKGSIGKKTSDLELAGVRTIDPDNMIGLDIYTLKISLDQRILFGKTFANGANNGCFYAVKQSGKTIAAEFEAAKIRIIKRPQTR